MFKTVDFDDTLLWKNELAHLPQSQLLRVIIRQRNEEMFIKIPQFFRGCSCCFSPQLLQVMCQPTRITHFFLSRLFSTSNRPFLLNVYENSFISQSVLRRVQSLFTRSFLPPDSVIQCFQYQIPLPSIFPKVIQQILKCSSSVLPFVHKQTYKILQ